MPARSLLVPALALVLLAGCGPEPKARDKGKAAKGAPPKADSGSIIGKYTDKVLPVARELRNGAKIYQGEVGSIVAKTESKVAVMGLQHDLDLYNALNNEYPKTAQEFADYLKASGKALPMLPPYLEYGYDEEQHKAVVLEYPDRRAKD